MSRKRTTFLLFVALMLASVVAMSLALGSPSLAVLGSADVASPLAPVGSGFTYQGRLTDSGGNPINDTCSLDFTLWDAESGGSVVGHQLVTGVEVNDGYLAVLLNSGEEFGEDAFTGEARWLKISVKCGGDADWHILPGRQLLSTAPYALSLRPGATISGTVGSGGSILRAFNNGPNGSGLSGVALNMGTGVVGVAVSSDGIGAAGNASSTSGRTYGVYGTSRSPDGFGGYFSNVWGGTALGATSSGGAAVLVESSGGDGVAVDSADDNGVYVESAGGDGIRIDSAGGYGVFVGLAVEDGVYVAHADGDGVIVGSANNDGVVVNSAARYGVYANTNGTYGFYTPDSVYVGGKIDLVGTVDPIIGERFKVDPQDQYEVGDLLVIDPDSPYLVLSSEPDDTKVIGVVGPGVDYEDGELMVVVFGWRGAKPAEDDDENVRTVARIKADASYGAIKRGDLLTTSPTPGHARKAQPVDVAGVELYKPGTILGKALGSLDSGQGLIEVFVILQ